MVAIKNILLFVTAAAAICINVGKRTVATTLKDISILSTDIANLDSGLSDHIAEGPPGYLTEERIVWACIRVKDPLGVATQHATTLIFVSAIERQSVLSAVTKLIPTIKDALDIVWLKASSFSIQRLKANVKYSLGTLRQAFHGFTNALLSHAYGDALKGFRDIFEKIDGLLREAIESF